MILPKKNPNKEFLGYICDPSIVVDTNFVPEFRITMSHCQKLSVYWFLLLKPWFLGFEIFLSILILGFRITMSEFVNDKSAMRGLSRNNVRTRMSSPDLDSVYENLSIDFLTFYLNYSPVLWNFRNISAIRGLLQFADYRDSRNNCGHQFGSRIWTHWVRISQYTEF